MVLTADEIKELKAMKPKVGHAWYDLSVPAIGGWNKFWKKGVSAWADGVVVYDNHANPDRLRTGAQFLIEQELPVAGTLSFDWIRSSESMRLFHTAKIAITGVATSPSAYYPPTCTCMTAAAVRNAGRRDVWVVASDLDEGTALTLLHGAWPVLITYSLPISGSGYADANVMGKILLGKRVQLIVLSKGTVVTSANVREASAHDWGGEPLPWQ